LLTAAREGDTSELKKLVSQDLRVLVIISTLIFLQ